MQPSVRVDRVEGDLMAVNSHLVHGPGGVVVVDGQLTEPDARKVRAALDGPPVAVIVTHPHPDHYAGAALVAGGAPIVATPEVAAVIERDDPEKDAVVGPMMGAAWPARRRFPDRLVAPGESVELAGLTFRVQDVGPGESHADTLWWLDDATVFAGDVASHDMHAYLADAHHESWLAALAALAGTLGPEVTLHLGHGAPADRSVLAAQRRYVEAFLDAVARHDGDEDAVVAEVGPLVSDQRLLFLMRLSVAPVHAALVAGRA